MRADNDQARALIRRCILLRESGSSEAVLRSEITSRIRLVFPQQEDESWINHYSQGTEARTTIGQPDGVTANRFIDNLVDSTTIEYESDLRIPAKFQDGTRQVAEHVAGLVREGISASSVRGILSDTVDWYAYDVRLVDGAQAATCSVNDVVLDRVDSLSLKSDDKATAERLVDFFRMHLAREQSRSLRAAFLADDFGLSSAQYRARIGPLIEMVEAGRAADPAVCLATDLWSRFVDHLEGAPGGFRADAYVDEAYLCILARLLAANVLWGRPIPGDAGQLESILDGSYFRDRYHLENMVEQDYFGWLTDPARVGDLVPIAHDIQRDLYAYDFGRLCDEDLFGRLMAQLAARSQRKILGQELTPAWLGNLLAERCLDGLPKGEKPRVIDMCCGSGSILAEVLKAARSRLNLAEISQLREVATGFDIDPLAVCLAKTTWIITLAAEINKASGQIIIPIYHADSLFAVTPVSITVPPPGESGAIEVSLDGETVRVPGALVCPEHRDLFERIIDWAYDEAKDAKAKGSPDQITLDAAGRFLTGVTANTPVPADLKESFVGAAFALAHRMARLAIGDRNGIWAFILRNAYRPGLLAGQFNGLVSNPPWLAMSSMADNPYRHMLAERARLYGIRPAGQSFLHLDLSTVHLVHAIDRYLAPNASIACLVPGTVFNGDHHKPFRQGKFLTSQRPVHFQIQEVWEIAHGTFNYPGGAVIGLQKPNASSVGSATVAGFVAREGGLERVGFSEQSIGASKIVWNLGDVEDAPTEHSDDALPQQGADIMPRVAVCVDVLDERGPEYRIDTPSRGSAWDFTLKSVKVLEGEGFPGYSAPRFIYRMAQSENLLPFLFGEHRAPIAIPAVRTDNGEWHILELAEIRQLGFIDTARRFQNINERLGTVGNGDTIQERIDKYGKLTKQRFGNQGHLVVAGAGGGRICAASIPVEEASRLVVDQTLYWQAVTDAGEAWYRVGMLNSQAVTDAIAPFNPSGEFGERHVHTLPYRVMPRYDRDNAEHGRISALSGMVAETAREVVTADAFLQDPSRRLGARRRRLREQLEPVPEHQELERLCSAALVTPP